MRALIHETMTGEFVDEIDFSSVDWATIVAGADEVTVKAPASAGDSWWRYFVPRKYTVSVSHDGLVLAAGILGIPAGDTDEDGDHEVTLPGKGIESYFERRYVLPYPYWPLVDSKNMPIIARNTRFTGVDYGTMMKRLYEQALTHPGAVLPVSFEANRSGSREKEWEALNGKSVQDAVDDVYGLQGGVEWDWVPLLDERDRLTWHLRTATDAAREISGALDWFWTHGGEEPDLSGIDVEVSPEFMCSTAIFTGGKDEDAVLVARATSTALQSLGVPLAEVWDSSHSSVSVQSTLNDWAREALDNGQAPVQFWSFNVRADRAVGIRHGDWCSVDVKDHWLIPDGVYRRRVLQVSGDHEMDWLKLVVGGAVTW